MTLAIFWPLAVTGLCQAITYHILSRIAAARRLQHIPGPVWASWTSLWLVRRQLGGRVARELAELSQKHGAIYRIAPNWVVISDPAEVQRVWQARGPWYRGRWYEMFRFDQPVDTVMPSETTRSTAHFDLSCSRATWAKMWISEVRGRGLSCIG